MLSSEGQLYLNDEGQCCLSEDQLYLNNGCQCYLSEGQCYLNSEGHMTVERETRGEQCLAKLADLWIALLRVC